MKVSLGEVIGVTENMSIKDISKKIEDASDLAKEEIAKLGLTVIMLSISTLQAEYLIALQLYNDAVKALNLVKLALGIGDVPTEPVVEISKSIKSLENVLVSTIMNTYVEI